MKTMSDTPETDEVIIVCGRIEDSLALTKLIFLARRLERETDHWKREAENAKQDHSQADTDTLRALHERNEARKERDERFTVEEIAEYLAGWTMGSFDEVAKLGAHVAHNALNQLRDEQDGIMAVRLRKSGLPRT